MLFISFSEHINTIMSTLQDGSSIYNFYIDKKRKISAKLIIDKNANYVLTIDSSVAFTQENLPDFVKSLMNVLYTRCSRTSQSQKLSLEVSCKRNYLNVLYSNQKIHLSCDALILLTKMGQELQLDHRYLSPHYTGKANAGTDVNFLRQLTVVCAQYYFQAVINRISETFCEQHKGKWYGMHEKMCSLGYKDSLCYNVAKVGVQIITKELLSEILKANELGSVYIDMSVILGDNLDRIIQRVHHSAFFFFSHALVLRGYCYLGEFFKECIYFNKAIQIPCEMCNFESQAC